MPRYRLDIEYDGSPFIGWQRQADGVSVQGAIEAAIKALEPQAGSVQGAGRTDSGVHAIGQVAHVDLARAWDPFRLAQAVNWHLKPHPIAIISACEVEEGFHARFSAIYRTYRYRIICRRAPLTIERGRAWRLPEALDVSAMQAAADGLIGKHDFTTFRSAHCQADSPVRTLDHFQISAIDDEIRFELGARSFLHNQVRSLVGTLEKVGTGKWPVGQVGRALLARDRKECGPVAPAEGLYLTGVIYPGEADVSWHAED